jgi:hypothetical protein
MGQDSDIKPPYTQLYRRVSQQNVFAVRIGDKGFRFALGRDLQLCVGNKLSNWEEINDGKWIVR